MSALITVGSTSFTPLIHSILLPSSLSSLQFLGITNLLVQAGNSALPEGWELGIKKKVGGGGGGGLEVEVIGFSEGLEELVGGMQVVVCHAGAGSILSFFRPAPTSVASTSTTKDNNQLPPRPRRRQLLLIPNSSLMDSHQTDLAEEFVKQGWATVCEDLSELDSALRRLRPVGGDTEEEEEEEIERKGFPEFVPGRMSRILDETLGGR